MNVSTFVCFFADLFQSKLKWDRPNENLTSVLSWPHKKFKKADFSSEALRTDPARMKRNTGAAAAAVTAASGEAARPKTLSGISSQGSTEVSSAAAERLADWRQSLSDQVPQRDLLINNLKPLHC